MIKAVIFDFDGLILDTETTLYRAWEQTYAQFGCTLSLEQWGANVGGHSYEAFHPIDHLIAHANTAFDAKAVDRARYEQYKAWVWVQDAIPGASERMIEVKEAGLRLGIASSSPREWVQGHLERLGLWQLVDAGVFGDEVEAVKPDPAIYLNVLQALGLKPSEAFTLEDSPKGIAAAAAAKLKCIAVPNPVTAILDLSQADHRIGALAETPLHALLALVEKESVHAL